MWISRIHYGLLLPFVLVVAGAVTFGSASAQSDAKLKELNQRVIELHSAGKYREAIPIAEEYVTAARKRHGDGHPAYATSINWLAKLLQATNRLAEAEPLMRRALAIDEKSFGPKHPNVVIDLNNLAQLLQETNRLAEAEPPLWLNIPTGDSSAPPAPNDPHFSRSYAKNINCALEPDSIRYIEVMLDPFASRMAVTPAAIKHLEDRQRILSG
jgi:tetratricopeptide (TPR) repeat protein